MNDFDTRMQLGAAYRRDPLETMHQFDAYQQLGGANAQRVDAFLARHGQDEAAAAALRRLVESPEFGATSPEVQASLLDAAGAHPDAGTVDCLRRLAADDGFGLLPAADAGVEVDRLTEGRATPRAADILARSGMPEVPGRRIGDLGAMELGAQAMHYVESMSGMGLAEGVAFGIELAAGTPVLTGAAAAVGPAVGGGFALATSVLGIYGSIHAAESARDEGRAIGEAAAHGGGFVRQLAELAGHGEHAPRSAAEARGAAAAERCWSGLRPSERVALQDAGAGRFFAALDRAVLQRASEGTE